MKDIDEPRKEKLQRQINYDDMLKSHRTSAQAAFNRKPYSTQTIDKNVEKGDLDDK